MGGYIEVELWSATSACRSAFSVYEKIAVRVNTNKRNQDEGQETKAN